MSSTLQKVVDTLFAFAEKGRRPLVAALLEQVNRELDSNALPALADYLQAAGLGWVVNGPASSGSGPAPVSSAPARVIHLVNQSTAVGAGDFAAAGAALQRQVLEHFAPLWSGLSCQLVPSSATSGSPQTPSAETIFVLDDSDQADALGYHELTQGDVPVGFAFARTSQADGSPWQSTLSHELLEQLADPYVQTAVLVSSFQGRPAALAYETADPVEADSYEIDGVPVSNFVTPAWFQDAAPTGARLDYLGRLTAPLTVTAGGYIAFTTDMQNWQQFTPALRPGLPQVRPARAAVLPYSRRFNRFWRGRGARRMAALPGWVAQLIAAARKVGIAASTVLALVARDGPAAVQLIEALVADLQGPRG
jgi:hypothetical protein